VALWRDPEAPAGPCYNPPRIRRNPASNATCVRAVYSSTGGAEPPRLGRCWPAGRTRNESAMTAASPRRIAVLGSTGSIGRQTLDVVRAYPERFRVVSLAARGNVALLAEQAREFAPELVVCTSDDPAVRAELERLLPQALLGVEGLTAAATHPDVETV